MDLSVSSRPQFFATSTIAEPFRSMSEAAAVEMFASLPCLSDVVSPSLCRVGGPLVAGFKSRGRTVMKMN